jgi:hypothetical protein
MIGIQNKLQFLMFFMIFVVIMAQNALRRHKSPYCTIPFITIWTVVTTISTLIPSEIMK